MQFLNRFLRQECGATSVEYAVVIGFIFGVCLAAVTIFGQSANTSVKQSSQELATALDR
jgi:Flp pilus assembly pilin Flp